MIKIIDTEFMVCADCFPIIANGDASHLDYSYDETEAAKRLEEIDAGLKAAGFLSPGTETIEFSTYRCDCCGSNLAGTRYQCTQYGEDTNV